MMTKLKHISAAQCSRNLSRRSATCVLGALLASRAFAIFFIVTILIAIASLVAPKAYAVAGDAAWTGSTSNAWATGTNWSPSGTIPGTGNTATFNAASANTTISLNGITVKTILFDTSSAAAYTLGSGAVNNETLTLNFSGAITVNSGVTNNQLFNATLTLGTDSTSTGSFTFTNNSATGGQLLTIAGDVTQLHSNSNNPARTLNLAGSGNGVISGVIDGNGNGSGSNARPLVSIVKTGAGTWTLSGANTYAGGTTIKAGTILAGNNAALGTGAALLGDTTGTSAASLLTNGAFTIANNITVQSGNTGLMTLGGNTANASIFTGTIALGTTTKDATFVALAGGSVDFQGVISDGSSNNSNVTIGDATHSGTVKFSNVANTYSGTTTIGNGATLEVTKLANGGSNSSMGNSGTSAAAGSAATDLVINNGTLKYTGTGDSTNRLFTIGTGGATIDASASANGALNFTGTGSLVASGTGNRTLTLTGTSTGANTMTSIIADPSSGATALTKSGAGTWVISGANTYSGDTTVSAGILRLGAANRIPDGAGKGNVSVSGTLDLNTFSETINGLSGAGTVDTVAGGTPTFTVGSNNQTSSFSGVIKNTAGTLALTKTGTGTLTLSGTSTYTGATTINASGGTLEINNNGGTNTGKLANTSGITVNSSGTLLLSGSSSVTDRINNAATVNLAGGKLNLNGLSEGAATVSGGTTTSATFGLGALTLSATSTIDFGAGDNGNKLVFSGLGTHTASTILQITNWDGKIFTGSGSEQLLFIGSTSAFTSLYNQADVSFNGITGYNAVQFSGFYEITGVPEPSTWAAGALAFASLVLIQRGRITRFLKRRR
jgi:fibronectin-binding autotransporter adhesin